MYFPYLYARQAELLALCDVTDELDLKSTVIPILKPTKASPHALIRCLEHLGTSGVKTLVITNPKLGDFKATKTRPASLVAPWRTSLQDSFTNHPTNIPAYMCRPETKFAEVTSFLSRYASGDVALVYWSPKFSDSEMRSLAGERRIRFHVNLHDQLSASQRGLLPRSKAVDVTDRFNAQLRNADYGDPELFTDSHLTFQSNGIGFGDYSVVGSKLSEGGGPAYAVAIHAVYKDLGTRALWVQHFVSDDTDITVGTTASKYLQAAGKLVRAARRRRTEFGNNLALDGFSNDVSVNHCPGLMISKRRQIHHHIATIYKVLTGTL